MVAPITIGATLLQDWEFTGYVASETRIFPEDPAFPGQEGVFGTSLAIEPELFREWDDRDQSFTLVPFFRWDSEDPERTHLDLREAFYLLIRDDWELRFGVNKVFWGVTESRHLVDTINQTDLVENIDTEDKLGQPMVQLSLVRDYGTFHLFVLPYFRERTFPGVDGRFRTPIPVDTDNPQYQSSLEEWRPDVALRYSNYFGAFDVGLHYFHGTNRDPNLLLVDDNGDEVPDRLIPVYNIMHQVGLDLQYTREGWLWKLEALARTARGQHFQAFTGGFEYTFYGLMGSTFDLGVLGEYHYDSRGSRSLDPFNSDFFAGARLTWNDSQDTALLAGVITDVDNGTTSMRAEFERRIGQNHKLLIEGQLIGNVDENDPLRAFREDSFLQIEWQTYF